MFKQGRVLIIAGSDSGGGAGIQADIKAITMLGGYAATAITAVTVQNTQGVSAIHPVPVEIIKAQIEAVLADIGADCIKTGMLASSEVIDAVLEALAPYKDIPLVVDPVMIAKGGARLLQEDALNTLKTKLLPRATLITPNIPEAEALTGLTITDSAGQAKAAQQLYQETGAAVLVKGGHLKGMMVNDVLVGKDGQHTIQGIRVDSTSTHGTGCTLASSIACGIAKGHTLFQACTEAQRYVIGAIQHATPIGKGHGPLKHNWVVR